MTEPNDISPPSQPAPTPTPDAAREGVSERGGEGGYGNDTGFATGTQAPRDDDAQGGLSGREERARAAGSDAGQGEAPH